MFLKLDSLLKHPLLTLQDAPRCSLSGLPPPHHIMCTCSGSLNLVEVPHLSSGATELHIQDNRLTSVSPGLFERLVSLKRVSLHGNPFHCDCGIQYLRNWLLKNREMVLKEPTCASPSSVAQRAIADLTDDHFTSCVVASCTGATYNTVMAAMLCCVIVLLLWSLKLAKMSTFTLSIEKRHTGIEAGSLQSLKPRYRRRLNTVQSEASVDLDINGAEDLERPLALNMELLPQVIDVLHRKHNIKIKAT
ncbi:platelet glycoprotein IX-like [Solea senegalensis]|uniref:Platelet glycoprotein IX-like n=1 Tax=Solea senegalensis TaxID=28829 RepID=A0AAV6SSP1_SOLSE|nr:platelet glycoprotein IX-like [Solea senegalensis]